MFKMSKINIKLLNGEMISLDSKDNNICLEQKVRQELFPDYPLCSISLFLYNEYYCLIIKDGLSVSCVPTNKDVIDTKNNMYQVCNIFCFSDEKDKCLLCYVYRKRDVYDNYYVHSKDIKKIGEGKPYEIIDEPSYGLPLKELLRACLPSDTKKLLRIFNE